MHIDQVEVPKFPRLSRKWLGGWKKEYKVSLKKPAMKFKVSHKKVVRRSRRTWLNTFKLDAYFEHCFAVAKAQAGFRTVPHRHCVDQKGMM